MTTAAQDAIIEALIPTVVAGIHAEDALTLAREIRRFDGLPPSPLINRMRAIVLAEIAQREADAS